MAELKASEKRLHRDLAAIGRKAKIREDYLAAIEQLRGTNIEQLLWEMADVAPNTFRGILALVFEPNSIVIATERQGNRWHGRIVDYQYTADFLSFVGEGSVTSAKAGGDQGGTKKKAKEYNVGNCLQSQSGILM